MFAFFMQLLLSVVVSEIAARLQKKPGGPDVGTVDAPTTTEDRPMQYGAGAFEVVGNIVWHGDTMANEVSESVKSGWFSSQNVAVGHRYYMGLWMTLTGVPCDSVTQIWYGDDLAWEGELALADGISELAVQYISDTRAKVPDGLQAKFRFFNRTLAESDTSRPALVNGYVEKQVKEAVPEYPNALHVVMDGPHGDRVDGNKLVSGFYGSSPTARPLRFVVRRFPKIDAAVPLSRELTYPIQGNQLSTQNRAAFKAWLEHVQDIEGDANPALLMLELLTSREPGISPSISPYLVDAESFLRAAAVLKAEGIGVSPSWTATASGEERALGLCKVMHGGYRQDPITGRISLKLARASDAPVMRFDRANIASWQRFARKTIESATNVIEVPFRDRENRWADRVALAKNAAGVKAAGTTIVERVEFPGVTRAALAQLLASRELRTRVSSLAEVSFEGMLEPGVSLLPGDVITVVHEPLGQTLRIRITAARAASLTDPLRVMVEGVEDFFRQGFADGAIVTPLPVEPEPEPEEPGYFRDGRLMLAPYGLSRQHVDAPLFFVLAGEAPLEFERWRVAAQAEYEWSDGEYPTYGATDHGVCVYGTATNAFSGHQSGSFGVQLTQAHADYLATQLKRYAPVHLLAGNEILYCTFYNLSGTTAYFDIVARGAYDTTPEPQPAGREVIVLTDYAIYPEQLQTDAMAGTKNLTIRAEMDNKTWPETEVSHRFVPYSTPARASLPYPPGYVRLSGSLPAYTPDTASITMSRSAALTVAIAYRDKNQGVLTYISEVNQACGLRFAARIGWQTDAGTWAENDPVASTVDATSLTVSTTNVPAGKRLGRLRVWTETSGGVKSRERVLYFNYTA